MRKFTFVALLLLALGVNAQNVIKVLQPELWLKADGNAGKYGIWDDVSGNEHHLNADTTVDLKQGGDINFNPTFSMASIKEALHAAINLNEASQLTVVSVYQGKSTSNEQIIWTADVKPTQQLLLSTKRSKGPQSITRYSQDNIDLPVINISSYYWGKSEKDSDYESAFLLGTANNAEDSLKTFNGDLAELLVFDRLLNRTEINILQSYLGIKYGTTLQYENYQTSSGRLIWDASTHAEYSFAIGGIGRDDGFSLYQKQAYDTEEPGRLLLAANTIAHSNTENTFEFKDGEFLMWGMNEKAPSPEMSDEALYPYQMPVLQRRWLMSKHVNGPTAIPTTLQFDVSDCIGESKICYLVIDRSGTADFSREDIEYIPASSLDNNIATFTDIEWDTDRSGYDVFSLSFGMDNGVQCKHPLCHNDATGEISIQVMGAQAPYEFTLRSQDDTFYKNWKGESRFQTVDQLEPGEYTLVVTDANQVTVRNQLIITNPEQFSTGLQEQYELELGTALELDASIHTPVGQTSYLWQNANGYYSTDSIISVNTPGEYHLTISNNNGCSVTDTILVEAREGMFYHCRLFPNPSRGNYRLDVSLAFESPIAVRVYDLGGQAVSEERRKGAANYSFNGYIDRKGIYLINIETPYGKESFKLLIE